MFFQRAEWRVQPLSMKSILPLVLSGLKTMSARKGKKKGPKAWSALHAACFALARRRVILHVKCAISHGKQRAHGKQRTSLPLCLH